jgi:DNA-binding protein H-NS
MEMTMRKPRDFDSELKALTDKTKALKERKILQLGELVIATGADALDPETLAGALLKTMEANDAPRREAWRKRGAEFFQGKSRKGAGGIDDNARGAQTGNSGAASA